MHKRKNRLGVKTQAIILSNHYATRQTNTFSSHAESLG